MKLMKTLFLIILIIHALIHLMGFVKAFELAQVSQLTQNISRLNGVLWLLAALLFITAGVAFWLKSEWWWIPSIIAIVLSQYLIFSSWQDARFGTIANVLILLVTIVGFGTWSFSGKYKRDVKSQLKVSAALPTEILTENDLSTLPLPVQNYLRYVGVVGKPKVKNFKVQFTGKIRQNATSEWMPFTAEQYNFLESSTRLFFLNATMKHLPVAGYHRFQNGDAFMDIRLLSLVPVQYQSGSEMGIAETVTFFNDMCFMAPATLIDPRIKWLETNGNQVKASFTNNGITISALLEFNEQGELVNFTSEDRFAQMDDGSMKQLPWSTPSSNFKDINGYKLMTYGDAVYQYPEGPMTYGNFNMKSVEYNIQNER